MIAEPMYFWMAARWGERFDASLDFAGMLRRETFSRRNKITFSSTKHVVDVLDLFHKRQVLCFVSLFCPKTLAKQLKLNLRKTPWQDESLLVKNPNTKLETIISPTHQRSGFRVEANNFTWPLSLRRQESKTRLENLPNDLRPETKCVWRKFLRLISKQIKGLDMLMVKLYDVLGMSGSYVCQLK